MAAASTMPSARPGRPIASIALAVGLLALLLSLLAPFDGRSQQLDDPAADARIHLVADTAGTSAFWRLIAQGQSEDFDRPQLIVCSVDESHDQAIEYTKELLCQYLAQQPHIAKASNVSDEVVQKIQSILGWPATKEQINKAKHLVPDELVHRITASGTPSEAKAKVEEYKKRGCTCPILYPVGGNFKLLIDTFAQV